MVPNSRRPCDRLRWEMYSCNASLTVAFLVRWPPSRSASLSSFSSIPRFVGMDGGLRVRAGVKSERIRIAIFGAWLQSARG